MSTPPAHVGTVDVSIDALLHTADLLLAGTGVAGTSAAARHRGASLALRIALELAVDQALDSAHPGLASRNMRAKLLCLRHYSTPEAARRASSLWAHLCLGCHYHQYEIGPTRPQVQSWLEEVTAVIAFLTV